MKYFVSIENTNYFYWQIELLIESFLMHGLQDDLVVCIAQNFDPKIKNYCKNLVRHKNKFLHENIGSSKNCLPLNRLYSFAKFMEIEKIECPYAWIHPDMVMRKPIDVESYEEQYSIIINNQYEFDEQSEEYLKESVEEIKNKNILKEEVADFFRISYPIVFKNLKEDIRNLFVYRIIYNVEEILKEKGPNFPCDKTGLQKTFFEFLGSYNLRDDKLSTQLYQIDSESPFIHYSHGLPPIFHKLFHKFPNNAFYPPGPYEILLENNISPSVEYVQKVIKSYMKRNY